MFKNPVVILEVKQQFEWVCLVENNEFFIMVYNLLRLLQNQIFGLQRKTINEVKSIMTIFRIALGRTGQ